NNTGLDGATNAAEDDLTVLDFSACTAGTPGNCTTANFVTTTLAIQDGGAVAVNGIAGLTFLPGSDTEALAVEPLSGDGTGGRLHLLTIDWATPAVTVDATLNLGVALKAALAVTVDGSEAFVLSNGSQAIFRVEIDTMAPSLTPVAGPAGTLAPNPGTASFKASFAPLP
ncbi:MAG: hypothetical protein KDH09_02100, partial [Chrysiogenetes bacterium]|nr:hypothetical protein [Chrysiogenetes bacterium]